MKMLCSNCNTQKRSDFFQCEKCGSVVCLDCAKILVTRNPLFGKARRLIKCSKCGHVGFTKL